MSEQQPLVVVAFGAPGTGKSTLCGELLARNGDAASPFRFAIIDEPTQRADIVALLTQMYNETADDIAAGRSVAALAQTSIMEARVESYIDFANNRLPAERARAASEHKRLVVVCDGHVLSDTEIYVRAKFEAGQISDAELMTFIARRHEALNGVSDAFARPALYCHLTIDDDPSGAKHHHRVCTQRNNAVESGVDSSVFARLAQYASEASTTLRCADRLPTNELSPTAVCDQFIARCATK